MPSRYTTSPAAMDLDLLLQEEMDAVKSAVQLLVADSQALGQEVLDLRLQLQESTAGLEQVTV